MNKIVFHYSYLGDLPEGKVISHGGWYVEREEHETEEDVFDYVLNKMDEKILDAIKEKHNNRIENVVILSLTKVMEI